MAKLKFYYGEMGSGKTASLIELAKHYENACAGSTARVIVMKPAIDTKNGDKLLSRNGDTRAADFLITESDDLFEVITRRFKFDAYAVFIDEAQFLTRVQIDQLLMVTAKLNIEVVAFGLRLNFNLGDENFAGATRLLQVAHELHCIESKCDICGQNQAIFSCLFENGKLAKNCQTILISDGEKELDTKAICSKCYFKLC